MIFLLNFPKHHKHFAYMTKTNDFIKTLLSHYTTILDYTSWSTAKYFIQNVNKLNFVVQKRNLFPEKIFCFLINLRIKT